MLIQFTLQELMIFLVCVLGIAVGVLALPILWNINKVVNIVHSLVVSNQVSINQTISTMPGIFENVGQISIDVRETTDKLKSSVPVILQDVEAVTSTAKGSFELAGAVMENVGSGINDTITAYKQETLSIMSYIQIFEEVLQIICRTFSANK